jgi:hypothetical protein
MIFANPGLLAAGLLCVGVPILIHILMRRRRRPVSWGAMEWLLEAYRQQRRRMRFEQLLLLALRCLLVALVGVALAKPLLGDRGGLDAQRPKTLAILLDDSLASRATGADGAAALETHKAAAMALIDQLDAARGDRAGLILLASPARGVVSPASSDLAEVKRLIAGVLPTDAKADVSGGLEAVAAIARDDQQPGGGGGGGGAREVVVALMSELREGTLDVATPWRGGPGVSRVLTNGPATQTLANVSLAGLEPLSSLVLAGESDGARVVPIRVSLARSGASIEQRSTVRAWLVDASRASGASGAMPIAPANAARAEVSWSAGQREAMVTTSAPLPAGADARSASDWVAIAQVDQDAIESDNWIARPLDARASLNIALVGPASGSDASSVDRFAPRDWLGLALAPTQTSVLAASSVRATRLEARDFVGVGGAGDGVPGVLRGMAGVVVTEPQLLDASGWRAMRAAAANGAMIMIVPPEAEQAQTWADAMRENLGVPWQVARAAREVAAEAGAVAPTGTASGEEDLLSVLRPELEDLTRSARVSRVLAVEGGLGASQTLLSLRDGSPVIIATRAGVTPRAGQAGSSGQTGGAGWVVLWLTTPSLAWTDMPAKPLMVPLVQELVRQGIGRGTSRRHAQAGVLASVSAGAIVVPGVVELMLAQPFAAGADAQPAIALSRAGASDAIRRAGLWRARDAGGAFVPGGTLAINPAHAAGNTTPIPREQVERWVAGQGTEAPREVTFLSAQAQGEKAKASEAADARLRATDRSQSWMLSFWLLAGAGVIALVEAVLARWFSHAGVRSGTGARASVGATAEVRA